MARLAIHVLTPAAFALIAAQAPLSLSQAQSGVWEISGAPGSRAPVRQCVAEVLTLARFEHRSDNCSVRVLRNVGGHASIDYSCGGAGFGHSDVEMITPRSLRISTQGISGGLPFNYVLQARRVDDCPKSASFARH